MGVWQQFLEAAGGKKTTSTAPPSSGVTAKPVSSPWNLLKTAAAKKSPTLAAKPAPVAKPISPVASPNTSFVSQMGGNVLGQMHDGGEVPKTGKYLLEKGETVVPAGRSSEYRKVYNSRRKKA